MLTFYNILFPIPSVWFLWVVCRCVICGLCCCREFDEDGPPTPHTTLKAQKQSYYQALVDNDDFPYVVCYDHTLHTCTFTLWPSHTHTLTAHTPRCHNFSCIWYRQVSLLSPRYTIHTPLHIAHYISRTLTHHTLSHIRHHTSHTPSHITHPHTGLDYVSHDDILPYTSTGLEHFTHQLFNQFFAPTGETKGELITVVFPFI